MPTPTYIPLATVTLGSAASSITFSSIPATYRDLVLVVDYTSSAASGGLVATFNGDTGGNYSTVFMLGFSGGTLSGSSTGFNFTFGNLYGANRSHTVGTIMDYSATDKHKTVLRRFNSAGFSVTEAAANRWANTAAITTIGLSATSGTIDAGSTFNLYGIAS